MTYFLYLKRRNYIAQLIHSVQMVLEASFAPKRPNSNFEHRTYREKKVSRKNSIPVFMNRLEI